MEVREGRAKGGVPCFAWLKELCGDRGDGVPSLFHPAPPYPNTPCPHVLQVLSGGDTCAGGVTSAMPPPPGLSVCLSRHPPPIKRIGEMPGLNPYQCQRGMPCAAPPVGHVSPAPRGQQRRRCATAASPQDESGSARRASVPLGHRASRTYP
ncbi:hypothetical protein SKAU_G00114430 [Synaphobranchus kaupii]|uniref:Uncharacterized protein n=1 Tax=Synaphobranchus kaupii TaxID=118154 RepID=A0A9Q1J6J6_SYNKA|nr:hypothetical protein SKAU_G00114430 [Synaphobranchus kaupii]